MRGRIVAVAAVLGVVAGLPLSVSTSAGQASLAAVEPPGSISGTVTNVGTDVVDVFALDPVTFDIVGQSRAAADGTYAITGLPAADYTVFFGASHPYWGPAEHSDEVWADAHDAAASTPVTVTDTAVTGIDAVLEESGRVFGKVTGNGAGLAGALVEVALISDAPSQDGAWYAFTDNNGDFSVPGLDVGTYEVSVDHDVDGFPDAIDSGVAVAAGADVDLGTFVVSPSVGAPSKPTALTVTPGVGKVTLRYGLPANQGAAPADYVFVTAWPWWFDILFAPGGLEATPIGLLNGVSNRFSVRFENSWGSGTPQVIDATPTGCQYLWFVDVSAGSSFCDEIRWLVYQGISEGYDDATFRPSAGVSRQAMAAFLYRFAGSPDGEDPVCTAAQFTDVPASHPFCGEIAWLVGEGITQGYSDGSFRGQASVSRQAMAAFLYRFAGSPNGADPECTTAQFSDVPADAVFCGEIEWLVDEGITQGYSDDTFRPGVAVSRQAMSAFLQRLTEGPAPALAAPSARSAGPEEQPAPAATQAPLPEWSDPEPPPKPVTMRLPVG